MLIADILAPKQYDAHRKALHQAAADTGAAIAAIETAAPSFAIAMQLASALKRKRYDAVLVHTNRQAIAAISAKKIAEKAHSAYAIVYQPLRCDETPRNIPAEISAETALWIFEDEEMRRQYGKIAARLPRSSAILPPGYFGAPLPEGFTPAEHTPGGPLRLVWLDEISDYTLLSNTVNAVASLPENDIELTICGTGKARHIMPSVRAANNDKRHTYNWKGNEYDYAEEAARAHAAIAGHTYATDTRLDLMRRGIPVLDAEDPEALGETIARMIREPEALREAGEEARRRFHEAHEPMFHVKQLTSLIAGATR